LRHGSTVILWGERVGYGPGGPAALGSVLDCARSLDAAADGAGLLEIPGTANGRGLREVGCVPGCGPGFTETRPGRDAAAIRDALAAGDLDAVVLVNADPVRDLPAGPEWAEALRKARFVLAVSGFENDSARLADVILPAESFAEREGTVTHPDGRLQRLRPSVPHPDAVRPGWQWLAELAARLDDELGIDSAHDALDALAAEVPFYAGITHDEIGPQGIRWQERKNSTTASAPAWNTWSGGGGVGQEPLEEAGTGTLRLGTYRSLWSGEVTERNPALRFLAPEQLLELAPADGERLGVGDGDEVEVRANDTSVRARVLVRERIRPGAGFLIEGTATENANALAGVEVVEVNRLGQSANGAGVGTREATA
jgi:NADH-quinone oxidoreductase subunit G